MYTRTYMHTHRHTHTHALRNQDYAVLFFNKIMSDHILLNPNILLDPVWSLMYSYSAQKTMHILCLKIIRLKKRLTEHLFGAVTEI